MNDPGLLRMDHETLRVPDQPVIPYIEGDGIGPDIWKAARRVIDEAVEKSYAGSRKITWQEALAGAEAFKRTGAWLPEITLQQLKDCLVSIKGPLTTPVGGGIRSLNVSLRRELDLYACVRPVRWFEQVPSPLVRPRAVDMVIFRENTEDLYAGIEWMTGTPDCEKLLNFLLTDMGVKSIRFPGSSSLAIKPVSKEGSQRLIRAAIRYAITHKRSSVTLVHKGNIMKYTEGAFRTWGYELAAAEFGEQTYSWTQWEQTRDATGKESADQELQIALAHGKLLIKDVIADNFFQQILLAPQDYSVIATLNLNGDYISDSMAAAVGGVGIAPGANINYETGHAIFEATHGTAPQLAGTDSANPSSLILSGEMMLRYLGWKEAADLVIMGLTTAIRRKKVTIDFYRQMNDATLVSCGEFASEIIANM
jgi:isocitrate dehydrogenase